MFSGRNTVKVVGVSSVLSAGIFFGMAGCGSSDKPHDYGRQRPDVYDLDERDRGLQSLDVNVAADRMAADLLSDPRLNESRDQWTMVVDRMEDKTTGRVARTDFDLFLQALKSRLAKQGRGRVQLIVNRSKFYDIRGRELEGGGERADEFGQGGGGVAPAPDATNPDFALTGVARSLERRGTSYYQIEFSVVNLRNRQEVWTGLYPVKVAR